MLFFFQNKTIENGKAHTQLKIFFLVMFILSEGIFFNICVLSECISVLNKL